MGIASGTVRMASDIRQGCSLQGPMRLISLVLAVLLSMSSAAICMADQGGGTGEITFGPRPGVNSFAFKRTRATQSSERDHVDISPTTQDGSVGDSTIIGSPVGGPVTISVRKPVPPLIGVSAMTCSTAGPIGGGGTTVGGPTAADCIVQAVSARNRGRRARQKQRAAPPRPQVDPIAVAWAALDKSVPWPPIRSCRLPRPGWA
jgi:hypothetical protein